MRLGKKARTIAPTVSERTSLGQTNVREEEPIDVVGANYLEGINTTTFKSNLKDSEFQNIEGYTLREGKLDALGGKATLTPTKPNSNRILGLFNINRFSGTRTHLRFTKSSVHRLNAGAWTAITGAALAGSDYDRFGLLFVEDRAFFNNNGLDVLQEINLGADTYAAAGNARKYKYYVVCNNRIIGANLLAATNDPTEVAGCGDRNYAQWDPATDISAFRTTLVEPEQENIDEITGLANANGKLMVFRSRTIVMGYPQPVASAPFFFKKEFDVGCNAPYSIRKVRNGIIWYDPFQRNIFKYDFKTEDIVPLGNKLRYLLGSTIGDPLRIFSSYDDYNNEYELCIELSFTTKVFRLNLDSGECVTHNVAGACCLSNSVAAVASTSIDGLGSTPIDDLTGTIDELSTNSIIADKIFGTTDGERVQLTAANGAITTLKSKSYRIPGYRQYIESVEIDFDRPGPTTVSLYITARSNTILQKTIELPYTSDTGLYPTIRFPINVECVDFVWQLSTTNQWLHGVVGYRVNRYRAGRI